MTTLVQMTHTQWTTWLAAAERDRALHAWRKEGPKLGRTLRRARRSVGWTQRELALAVGCSQGWLQSLERGVAPERSGRRWMERALAACAHATTVWPAPCPQGAGSLGNVPQGGSPVGEPPRGRVPWERGASGDPVGADRRAASGA